MVVIIDPITVLIPVPDWFNDLMIKMVSKDIYSFVTIVMIAPIFEELIFRGIILDGFLKVYSPKKSIIWSSVLFALIHLNPWQAIGAFLIGLFIGWVYYRTQSIIPCILIHFTNNLIAFQHTI
jgi:membrane protease YdiL (CAAX protease family)